MEENKESAFVGLVTGHKVSCFWYKIWNFSTGFMNVAFFLVQKLTIFSAGFMNFGG
ncbi:hypothetical protein Hanom_Chr08g00748621 [Helianthus anomalus]